MTTFYVAITEGSGFDTAVEQDFDTGDNASGIENQASEGVFQRATMRTSDGRTLFKVEGGDEVVDRYEDFLTGHFPAGSRNQAGIARHFNTVQLFKPPTKAPDLFTFTADVTESQFEEYRDLFPGGDNFEAKYLSDSPAMDTDIIGRLEIRFTDDVWGRQWLVRFLNGVDEKYALDCEEHVRACAQATEATAATNPADEEDKLAFIYDWLGDAGMNLYLRARQSLRALDKAEGSLLETYDKVSKWRLTEWLIRTTSDTDGRRPTPYGVPCNDAPFTDALDSWWGDECRAYSDFGGPDGKITEQEFATARANASDPQAIDRVLLDVNAMEGSYSFPGLGTLDVYGHLGAIYLRGYNYLVVRDRARSMRFNHELLANNRVVAQLEHLRWQLKDTPNDNTEFQWTTLGLIDGCLAFAERLRADSTAALAVGTTTYAGTVIDQVLTTEGDPAIVTQRGAMTEFHDVSFGDFDAYVRHVQGEVPASADGSTPTTAVCEDGAFTSALDTWDVDECVRYYGTMDDAWVSRQSLDELYSSSGEARGVKDAIDHFTTTVRVFTVSVVQDTGLWDSEQLTVDPLLHTVKFWAKDLATADLTSETRAQLEYLITRLEALGDAYTAYARLIREKMPAAMPPAE